MPMYQYACQDCNHRFEKRQSFHDAPLTECPQCHGRVQRVISPVGIIFKGSGFYVTDNKAKNSNGSTPKPDKAAKSKKETSKEAAPSTAD